MRYFYKDPKREGTNLNPLRQALCYKVSEHGWTINFGEGIQFTTAFSREALFKELEYLVKECGYKIFDEVKFQQAKKSGLIVEMDVLIAEEDL